MKCNKILVALSGGVDSSVCVYLMKQQGYDVTGLVLHLSPAHNSTVAAAQAAADARLAELGIDKADFTPRYSCSICNDTGYDADGKPCRCLKKFIQEYNNAG